MKNVKIIYFVILFTLITLLGVGLVQAQESMTTQLQGVLEDAVNSPETAFPGAMLYVKSPDLGTWTGAAGLSNIETSIAMKSDDKFRAGSTIKPMIAVIILQLVEEGKFSLNDPMTAVLPESVTTKFTYSDQITVRMLLNHTSGMADCIEPVMNEIIADTAKVWEADEWLDVAAAQEPYFAPGEDWTYSNTDYILLGLVIEQATGRSWRESLRERIIEKLNLENTLLPEPGDLSIPGNYAHGYMDLGAGLVNVTGVDPSMADAAGGSALVTTTTDLARFLDAVLAGEFFQNTGTLAEMLTFVDVPEGSTPISGMAGYGLGMMKSLFPGNIEMIGHSGDTAGFSSFAFHLPAQGITVSGVVNDMDPSGILFRVLLPALEVLVPDFKAVTEIQAPDYQKIIDEVLQDDRPGIALRVITPEFEVLETRGYVDWEKAIPLEKDHLFRIASCTKTFIATLTLMMHFEGGLNLDDSITMYLPESITSRIQYADQITIRQMLNHTSGIFNTGDNPEYWAAQYGDPTKEWTDTEVLEFALDHPANFEPGSGYAYSNTDYLLAGLILDQVLGHHHSADVRSRILEPLGLSSTFYEQKEPFDREMLSHGYFDFDGDGIAEDYYGLRIETGRAEGGLVSTAGDLAAFITALATQRDFPNAEYREQFMQELLTIQPVASGEPGQVGTGPGIAEYDYGYGPGYGHSGGIPGYVSLMIYFPDHDVTFAMTWNGFDGGFADFGMVPALYEALIEGTFSTLGIESTLVYDASAGNFYEDPAGRFTMSLIGDWTPVETDGTYAKYAFSDMDLAMSLISIEASDVEGDMATAMQSVGVDPASLTETYRGAWNKWSLFYYDTASGEGVTVLGQVQDGIGYYVVATGDAAITSNPPDDVMKTIEGFALTGEVVLPSTVAEFESYVNDIVGLRPPALSIAIATTDDLIYAKGFGIADRPEDIQATSDTVYFWGSITKTVTATAIMQLREQGLVDLEAPVSDYLDYVPAQHGITVWNLLTHSSGLPEPKDWLPSHLRLEGQPLPDADVMDRDYYAELTDLMFEPGSQSAYANPDFVTLGQIVAAVSGQSYVEYVREHILGPLGMVNTDFEYSTDLMLTQAAAPATSLSNREAMITIIDDARGLGDATSFFRESDENTAWMNHFIVGEAAGGGLMGPATEMVRYAQMLANGGELNGVRILSAESVELLRQEQVSNSGEPLGFGMAWHIRDETEHPYIEHGGGGEGVDALLRVYYNDGFTIALEANSGGYSRQEMMDAAANVVFSMLTGQ